MRITKAYIECLFLITISIIHSPYCFGTSDTTLLNHKIIPAQFDQPIQIALSHYPELIDARIEFRIRNRQLPYASRPRLWSVVLPFVQKRYVITISNKTTDLRTPTLLQNLSLEAQVGAIGHELAHTAYYHRKRKPKVLLNGLHYLMSDRYKRHFEKMTDRIVIAHGLGHPLLRFCSEVYPIKCQDGKRKSRYFSPEEIKAIIAGAL
jgi:hypothetical protein